MYFPEWQCHEAASVIKMAFFFSEKSARAERYF
jgi:hypothetical protein